MNKKYNITNIIILLVLSVIIIYPHIFTNIEDFYFNSDGYFHFQRFLDICKQLNDGIFSPYMNYYKMDGFGYPLSLFYPDIFYYPFALLTLFGVSYVISFKLFLSTVLICSALSMYVVCRKILKNTNKNDALSVIFALLYAFNYFQYKHFIGGRFAELTASIFIPIFLYGMYSIIKKQEDWIYLVIGMCGLIYSHILTSVVCFITLIIFYILNYKIIIKKLYILIETFKAGLLILFICAKQIFPMAEMMFQDKYMYLESFCTFPEFNDMTSKIFPYHIPYVYMIILLAFILLQNKLKIEHKMIGLGILLWLLNTNLFDWNIIKPYLEKIMTIIQMPRRFFVPVISLLIIGICIIYTKNINKKVLTYIFKIFSIIFLFFNVCIFMYAPNIEDNGTNSYLENIENFNNNIYLGGYDYVPLSFDFNGITDETDDFTIKVYNLFENIKQNSQVELTQNKNIYKFEIYGNNEYIEVPILYYKGYSATTDIDSLNVKESDNGLLSILVPNGKNTIIIKYTGTFIQHLSLYISFLGILILIFFILSEKLHKNKTVFSENTIFYQNSNTNNS